MTTAWVRRIPFQVDIAGVIEILGSALYSRPDVAIRELIQNAHDAVQRRRRRDLAYKGRIDVEQDAAEHVLRFHDDGIGLSPEEAERYLGTLGIGITGLIKGRGPAELRQRYASDAADLIGQFGIGLFSAFMLAERMVVESRRLDCPEGVRWEAGPGTEIELSGSGRAEPGTTITLYLKPECHALAEQSEPVEAAIKEFADFLSIPIFLNRSQARVNVINAAWFDATPEAEAVELELEGYFGETPLDMILLRREQPVHVAGALYVSPQRVPGFAGESVLTVTVRRMVISRRIQGLLPEWASFLRGVLELNDCTPTLSREGLVRDAAFEMVRTVVEQTIYEHLERLAAAEPQQLQAVIAWHRYTLAGAALSEPRLRQLLAGAYRFTTSQGQLTFDEILQRSEASTLVENDADHVLWYNTDRRQERWANALFSGQDVPCVHTLRSFEESLLAAFAADASGGDTAIDMRLASPSSPGFATTLLGVQDMEEAPTEWQEFFAATGARILVASFESEQPVLAFLNEKHELVQTFEDLRKQGTIPTGFQRMIDAHLAEGEAGRNEVLLNRGHRLVGRALTQKTSSPLASVLRLLVLQALTAAGATVPAAARRSQTEDLDWIAEALWGKRS